MVHNKRRKRFILRNVQASNLPRKAGGRQSKITNFFDTDKRETIRHISIDDEFINCFQANNQKRIESCEKLTYYCDKLPSFLVLGQEPSTVGMSLTGFIWRHTIESMVSFSALGHISICTRISVPGLSITSAIRM